MQAHNKIATTFIGDAVFFPHFTRFDFSFLSHFIFGWEFNDAMNFAMENENKYKLTYTSENKWDLSTFFSVEELQYMRTIYGRKPNFNKLFMLKYKFHSLLLEANNISILYPWFNVVFISHFIFSLQCSISNVRAFHLIRLNSKEQFSLIR